MAAGKSKFEQAYEVDCSAFIEKKDTTGGRALSYLSWANAWAQFKVVYPDATYEIVKNTNGLPYFPDYNLGIMVYTRVTAGGETHEMWLPVMDGSNKAMKMEAYTYTVKDYSTRGYVEKAVKAADMFDINKTLMRCLTKNLAMFGLGLSIYAGEDIPQPLTTDEEDALKEDIKAKRGGKRQTKAAGGASTPQKADKAAETPETQQVTRVTMDMYKAGRCRNIVAWLTAQYDAATATIPEAARQEVASRYQWDADALQACVDEASKTAFKNDLNQN